VQNVKPTDLPCVSDRISQVSDVIDRIVAIAPAPLLPGENQADYADVAARFVKAARPKDTMKSS
jgi:hypothetical protein